MAGASEDVESEWLNCSVMFYGKILLACLVTFRMVFDAYYFINLVIRLFIPMILKYLRGEKHADLLSEHCRTCKYITFGNSNIK